MPITRMFAALCFFVTLALPVFAASLPAGDLPTGYEHWEKRVHSCAVKKGVTVELYTFTLRSAEAIMSAVSVWYVNGEPIEAKYVETVPEPTSLSGYRARGYSVALDKNGKWVKLGNKMRTMTDNERILLRLSRFAHLERFGVTEREFTSALAACNRDRPGELR